jgi:hypothetical protein
MTQWENTGGGGGSYHDAEKKRATSFLPPNADAVSTPKHFPEVCLVSTLGPKSSVLQLADAMMMRAGLKIRRDNNTTRGGKWP